MRYVRCLLACLLASLAAAADPEPSPDTNPFAAGWDKPGDPDKDCKFRREKGGLTITVPAKYHDLDNRTMTNAPRLVRDVSGDFVAEARVRGRFNPSAPSTESSTVPRTPFVAAGLVLMASGKPIAILERQVMGGGKGDAPTYSWVVWKDGKGGGKGGSFVPSGKDAYLRLARKGDELSASISEDGKRWTELQGFQVTMPAKLKLGVVARTTSSAPFSPQFDRFTLRRGGKR